MVGVDGSRPPAQVKDGRSWRIGTAAEVAWIADLTTVGLTITSAIPAIFDSYLTIVVPEAVEQRTEHERVILGLLCEQAGNQPWWLGYLETGGDEVVFPAAPRVTLYADSWRYVLVEAGPHEAATWRHDPLSSRGAMPDLVFPADRSWLLSRLWDDGWRCLGGPSGLADRLLHEPWLDARRVELEQDATPPGHTAR